MRLLLVEHGGERVCGDTAVFAVGSAEWAENTFQKISLNRLALIAARLLDESEGRNLWIYEYSPFGPLERGGYDVFAVGEDSEDAPLGCFKTVSDILCRGFYMGYVRCVRPAIAFNPGRRGEQFPSTEPSCSDPRRNARSR